MSATVLPMPEPPDEDLHDLVERLVIARRYRDDAADVLYRLRFQLEEPDGWHPEQRLHLSIEVDLAERRLIRWGVRIERLGACAAPEWDGWLDQPKRAARGAGRHPIVRH